MGLDIAFNRAAALAAGLKVTTERNGDNEQIAAAHDHGDDDYAKWLNEQGEYIHIPMTNLQVHNGGVDEIVVRANKWGSVYYPLTEWLKKHNIEWSEF